MTTQRPVRKDGVLLREMGDECLLYDEERSRVHILNMVAGFVWQLCDGTNGVSDLERRVREAYDVPHDIDLATQIQGFVAQLGDLGLLSTDATESGA